jgi:hypothetical protein
MLPFVAMTLLLGCETEPPAAGAQQSSASAKGAQSSKATRLCLELQSPQERVQLGEPLSLVASLINCSSEPQQVDDLLSPEFGFLQVFIQPPDGKELLHRPITKRDGRGKRTQSLGPGERLSALAPVYASAEGWTIARPGRYRFRAQYAVEATRVDSKPIDVTVTPPETDADRQAANIMMSREVGWFLIAGRDEKSEGSKRLAALVKQYPQSRLAPYARVGLAVADSRERFDSSTKTFRQAGCERAVEELARAVPEVADLSLAATGTASWIRCLRQLGRDKEVAPAADTFRRSHPAAKDVPAVNQLLGVTRQE